ncbi:MAG: hypothetical protein ACRCUT_13895 [Spirochaetota bacterium]
MNVKCSQCGREHSLPDDASDNKRIYFYCSGCRRKIVVDGRKNFIAGTSGSIAFKEEVPPPMISDILDIIPRFFRLSSFALTLVFGISFLIITVLAGVIAAKNAGFFLSHLPVLFIAAGFFFSLLVFLFNLLLYFISKIQNYYEDRPDIDFLDWKFILFDLPEDSITFLILSVCSGFFISLLLFPLSLLESGGVLYTALIFPLMFAWTIFLLVTGFLFPFIPAFIAERSLPVKQSFIQILRFFKKEILTLPFYFLAAKTVYLVVAFISISFFSVAVILPAAGAVSLINSSVPDQLKTLVFSLPAVMTTGFSAIPDSVSSLVTGGAIAFSAVFFILLILLWAFLVNINQALAAKACRIMTANPSSSISKPVMLTILILLGLFLMLFPYSTAKEIVSALVAR